MLEKELELIDVKETNKSSRYRKIPKLKHKMCYVFVLYSLYDNILQHLSMSGGNDSDT